MQITHVLRGEEWLPSAPLHKLLFDAFGWPLPVLVHLPVILKTDGKGKMSKRDRGALVAEYREEGFLPEAMFNFLTNVGWNFDAEREVFTREEAIERFDVAEVVAKPAALNRAKLEWLNGLYIRTLPPAELHLRLVPFLSQQLGIDEASLRANETLSELIPLIQERLKLLTEAAAMVDWALISADALVYPDLSLLIGKKMSAEQSLHALRWGAEIIATVEPFSVEQLEPAFRTQAEAMDVKVGSFFQPFRVAITGKLISPPLFESMVVVGRAETLQRVRNAGKALQAYTLQMV